MTKVFLEPTGLFSIAMQRVAKSLALHAPKNVLIVDDPSKADLRVIHVVGHGSLDNIDLSNPYVVIQYCIKSTKDGWDINHWLPLWQNSRMLWSYYNFSLEPEFENVNFYYSPLGVDKIFVDANCPLDNARDIPVMTSGYVTGPHAEAIEEVAMAADVLGLSVLHLGPEVIEGMQYKPIRWKSVMGISDTDLASIYGRVEWVSGLRQIEGFELPALEGLVCGARPIVFDRPDMREWYDEHAIFIPESSGFELTRYLEEILRYRPRKVSPTERAYILSRFDWAKIAKGFWERLL
jgi:hypothetical protein